MLDEKPTRIVFIDDKRKNVEGLEPVLEAEGVGYIGVHYTAIYHTKPIYTREIADFQYKFFDQIMSNEAALTLMEHGYEK